MLDRQPSWCSFLLAYPDLCRAPCSAPCPTPAPPALPIRPLPRAWCRASPVHRGCNVSADLAGSDAYKCSIYYVYHFSSLVSARLGMCICQCTIAGSAVLAWGHQLFFSEKVLPKLYEPDP